VEVVASLSQGRTAAAQCGLFTYKSVPVIFEPSCIYSGYPSSGHSMLAKCEDLWLFFETRRDPRAREFGKHLHTTLAERY